MNTKTFPRDRACSFADLSFRGIQISVSIEEFTVTDAVEALVSTALNRPMSRPNVARIAASIKRGEWIFNGETVVFDAANNLIQGQHRMHAVIATETPIVCLVVRGIDAKAFMTFDSGKVRSAPDALAIDGHKNVNRLAAGARCYLRLTEGQSSKNMMTPTRLLEVVKAHPELEKWTSLIGPGKGFVPSMIVGVLTRAEELHPHIDYETFLNGVTSGVGLTQENPAYLLRERFMSRKLGQVFSEDMNTALCVKAINAFTTGTRMKLLKVALNDESIALV
jgi:hypothetical protein